MHACTCSGCSINATKRITSCHVALKHKCRS
jgi:hypothetical protein